MNVCAGEKVVLSAKGTTDADRDKLTYKWWQDEDADTYKGSVQIQGSLNQDTAFIVPADGKAGETIHVICEVTDAGTPPLTGYQRVVLRIEP